MYHRCLYLKVCDAGFYGAKCLQECSRFCNKERDCYPILGQCKGGCKSGWEGPECLVGKTYSVNLIFKKMCSFAMFKDYKFLFVKHCIRLVV